MREMKIESFWKCLQRVLGEARFPDRQQVNPWPIVKREELVGQPPVQPRRGLPSSSESVALKAASDAIRDADRRRAPERRSLNRSPAARRTPLFVRL